MKINQDPPMKELAALIELCEQGQFDLALQDTKKLLKKFPKSPSIYKILGKLHNDLGDFEASVFAHKTVTKLEPENSDGYIRLGNIYELKKDFDAALNAYSKALSLSPKNAEAFLGIGNVNKTIGKFKIASEAYQKSLKINPRLINSYNNLGYVLMRLNQLDEAISAYRHAIDLNPSFFGAIFNLGIALKNRGEVNSSIKAFKRVIELKPNYMPAYNYLGLAYQQAGQTNEAINAYQLALSIDDNNHDILVNLGNLCIAEKMFDEGNKLYEKALNKNPNATEVIFNLGNANLRQGFYDKAVKAFKKCIDLNPTYAEAYLNLGISFEKKFQSEHAIDCYRAALEIKHDFADAHLNLGNLLLKHKKLPEALLHYEKVSTSSPRYADALYNIAHLHKENGDPILALTYYNKALEIRPEFEQARASKLALAAKTCSWDLIEEDEHCIASLGMSDTVIHPFELLSLDDNFARDTYRNRSYSNSISATGYPSQRQIIPQKDKVIKIGYFSSDFREHPVSDLILRMLSLHDRSRFKVFAYSLNDYPGSQMQMRVQQSVDEFKLVHALSPLEIAELAKKDEINIAIDLNGYTLGNRVESFIHRVAPIQIQYLGYGPSMEASFFDYIICDEVVIPPNQENLLIQKPIYLPHTHVCTDDTRKISDREITKSEMGLPDNSFVFCCFNSNYKITAKEFNIWANILRQIENSVLWLMPSSIVSRGNLLNEAKKRGIDNSRIIFTKYLPADEHIARYKLADLFIDTFNYNAATTATEALWAGLPVVTKRGNSFTARLCSSILNALDLNELITSTEQEYEDLIINLAKQNDKLGQLKSKVAQNIASKPLFDTTAFTRCFENGLQQAHELAVLGSEPRTIYAKDK